MIETFSQDWKKPISFEDIFSAERQNFIWNFPLSCGLDCCREVALNWYPMIPLFIHSPASLQPSHPQTNITCSSKIGAILEPAVKMIFMGHKIPGGTPDPTTGYQEKHSFFTNEIQKVPLVTTRCPWNGGLIWKALSIQLFEVSVTMASEPAGLDYMA